MGRSHSHRAYVLFCAAATLANVADAQPAAKKPPVKPPAPVEPAPLPTANVPDLTAAVAGGITSEQVGTRAAQTSWQMRSAAQLAEAASARVDLAEVAWAPRLLLTAKYTHFSPLTPPELNGPPIVTVNLPGPATAQPLPAGTQLQYITSDSTFPIVLDNYLLNATLTIPISDYFLKVNQNATAATHSEEAARYDVLTARAKSFSDGKNAYYTWLRARGAQTVAEQTLVVAQSHLKDANSLFTVGGASKADILRAETQVAAADLLVARAKGAVAVAERQVRVAMHAPDEEVLNPGEALDTPLPPAPSDVKALVPEAIAKRPEIKSADRNAEAARKTAAFQRAGRYPAVSAFGDLTYANPNARKFPTTQEWFPTWFIGAQVTWAPNDALTAGAQGADYEARAAALDAQRAVVRDGIEVEVVQAYEDLIAADIGITTTERQLDSAVEGYRVARELFNLGRNTSTALIDAETALTQARIDHLNARVDARTARVRLDHALGRDARGGP